MHRIPRTPIWLLRNHRDGNHHTGHTRKAKSTHSSAVAMHWAARPKALFRVLHPVPDNKLSIFTTSRRRTSARRLQAAGSSSSSCRTNTTSRRPRRTGTHRGAVQYKLSGAVFCFAVPQLIICPQWVTYFQLRPWAKSPQRNLVQKE